MFINGATAASYTLSPVVTTSRGKFHVIVTGTGGSAGNRTSAPAYLNTVITIQPSVVYQTIATGNNVTLLLTADNATGYQWTKNGADIVGATSATYTINPLTLNDDGDYQAQVLNSANGGCASLSTNVVTIKPSVNLYSNASGNINSVSTWGANTSGSGTGSNPVNFLNSEHIFTIQNRSDAETLTDLKIAGTLDLNEAVLTITPGTTLTAGTLTSSASGSLAGTPTSSLSVDGLSDLYFEPGNETLQNLTITGGIVNLNTDLNLTAGTEPGILTVSNGTFNTGDLLTLKSDANGTATIGASAGTINGKAIIERFMPARRAWRLMGPTVSSTGAPTINEAWQEGATSSTDDLNPGFGTHITGGTALNGFDRSPTNSSSLKYFGNNSFIALPNTNATPVTQYSGYFFFVRGNRAYTITSTVVSYTALTTVLRAKGNLNQGTQPAMPVAAAGFTLVSNPYASPVSFSALQASGTNVKNRITVWDPALGGTLGVGAYVVLDWNGSGYTSVPSSAMSSTIQPGQAFFVQSDNGISAGSVVFNEAQKVSGTSTAPFGRPTSVDSGLMIDFRIINSDKTTGIVDGVLARFNDAYLNEIDNDDALKTSNLNENLSILSNGKKLTIERRKMPLGGDTMVLNVSGLKATDYRFDIIPKNFENTGVTALLYDRYLQTLNPLSSTDTSHYTFTVTADALSKQAQRFSIVCRSSATLPVTISSVKAKANGSSSINVEWEVMNEQNISHYEVEKFSSANNFKSIGTVQATAGGTAKAAYGFTDASILDGDNSYRIKSIGSDGEIKYSAVVKVNIKATKASALSVYPNPVQGRTIMLSLSNIGKGQYQVKMINQAGQTVHMSGFTYHGNNTQAINLSQSLPAGIYNLYIQQGSVSYKTNVLVK